VFFDYSDAFGIVNRTRLLHKIGKDTKISTRIKDTGDNDLLEQDLNMLMEWLKQWLLAFNSDRCKVMHVGHELPMVYTMSDGNSTTQRL